MILDCVARSPPPSQQPGREKQQRPEQSESSFHRDSNQTQRQRHQPDQRKQNQREHRQRPAEHEQDAPTDKQNQYLHNARILSRAAVKSHYKWPLVLEQSVFSYGPRQPWFSRFNRLWVCHAIRPSHDPERYRRPAGQSESASELDGDRCSRSASPVAVDALGSAPKGNMAR